MRRSHEEVRAELRLSLGRLHVDAVDLYQLHAVCTIAELEQVTAPGGALEALLDARAQGLTRFLGITGHSPAVLLEGLRRFDFDSVLFPVNYILWSDAAYRRDAQMLLRRCRAKDVGVMAIKAIAKRPWGKQHKTLNTWYEPFTDQPDIQEGVDFALSHGVTGLCTAGDISLLPSLLEACERATPMERARRAALVARGHEYEPIFAREGSRHEYACKFS